ncbi:vacuolar protein sorting-associated protein 18 homolog [Pomacea canaliculata]|uniref:vacuolar protein sorting-associated protein 18 homolog n=1 Tax=Pomacea canaliculata TaxID=400727 RepID=UPI000D72B73F|nr:vacuolar protein sorting-associated protein 18 homolog [Pomacea canaliculata]
MASILDQYEEEFTRTSTGKPAVRSTAQDIGLPGYVDARLEDETPIFSRVKLNYKCYNNTSVCWNNILVLALSTNCLVRVEVETQQATEIELPSPVTDRVHQIFLDPTGKHLLISLGSQENYYVSLGTSARKPKNIAKLKGHLIDSVGWNWQNANEKTTGAILLGTNKGLIFETELTQFDDSRFFQGNVDLYLKQLFKLFNLGRERAEPVTGLQFDRMPCSDLSVYRYYILVTTPGRLYQFIGTVSTSADPPMFTPLFQQYESGADHPQFLELPGNFGYSDLHLFFPKFRQPALTFAWLTGPGIYYGNIDVTGSAGPNSVMSSSKLIPYPKDIDEQKVHPIGMALTEFHMLVLYSDRTRAICSLNEQMILDDVIPDRFGRMLGIRKDPIRGTIWAFSSQVVFFYKVCRESRDVWQMYLEKGDFEVAKKYCQDSRFNLEKVLIKQAEHLFEIGKYEESAAMYAQTQNSFEEVALKFIKLSNKEPLQTFIIEKLSSLRPQDKTQMTMLVTWIVELFLNTLGRLKEQGQDETYEYESTQEKFRKFMASMRIKECITLNRTVIYDLISSHGDIEDLVFFAHLMKDYERVINHHFHHENYRGALECLIKQPDIELYYKFSPVLMQHLPRETVDAWIRVGKQLDPKKLIPALVQYDHLRNIDQGNEAIRYLETCIQKFENRDSAIHNYLLALYAKFQPDHLMTYLQLQGEDPDEICYDVKYALRLCTECNHHRACVHVYSLMGLYEEAVDMALTVDVELAKQQANKPAEDDLELRKKLWLRIARHVVEEEKDIKRAMEFLHECDLLKIEDVLPFFPDFVTIDHFKDAIVSSLQEYNQHIESLKIEMEEATQSAEEIRREIQSFRNKYSLVKAEDKCSVCTYPLMSRAFYLFPCGHKFHMDCLIAEVLPTLPTSKKSQVESLQRKLAEMEGSPAHNRAPGGPEKAAKDMDVQTKLHDLVSSECIFCGDFMIRCIDKQFVEEEKWSIIVSEWE